LDKTLEIFIKEMVEACEKDYLDNIDKVMDVVDFLGTTLAKQNIENRTVIMALMNLCVGTILRHDVSIEKLEILRDIHLDVMKNRFNLAIELKTQ
jgi:hypothetical protein